MDGHLDLAVGALQMRRDLTRSAEEVRRADSEDVRKAYGTCTVTLPDLRRGGVAVVFGTIMAGFGAWGAIETLGDGSGPGSAAFLVSIAFVLLGSGRVVMGLRGARRAR